MQSMAHFAAQRLHCRPLQDKGERTDDGNREEKAPKDASEANLGAYHSLSTRCFSPRPARQMGMQNDPDCKPTHLRLSDRETACFHPQIAAQFLPAKQLSGIQSVVACLM